MDTSILNSTKKILGIAEDYTAFDYDIITHINTVFATLTQIGIGPPDGFMIEDETAIWSDFIAEDPRFNAIRTYVFLKVKMMFDPPQTSYMIESLERQITEFEWRLNVTHENDAMIPVVEVIEEDM
jgi:hypothetical protein